MGQILSQPVTEKHSEDGSSDRLAYGLSCMQGWRINMEDAHATILDYNDLITNNKNDTEGKTELDKIKEKVAFFGVYDGHGGEKAAIFAGKHLHDIVAQTKAFKLKDYVQALKDGFLNCDQEILRDYEMKDDDSGCAATSAIITQDAIYCGNAGDSRTIMSINGYAKALSYDHKPSNEGEKTRICSAGGYVDMGRVNGNLALSRGIGDFEFKRNPDLPAEEQIVTCYPDVLVHQIDFEKDEFIVLACDGIWDCLTSQQCVECVRRGISERKLLTKICEEIMELCCAPTSDGSGIGCDNMSIVIVALLDESKNETLDQWYEKIIAKVEKVENDPTFKQYGPIAPEYDLIYKDLFGAHYLIGQHLEDLGSHGAGSSSSFGSRFGGAGGAGGEFSRNGTSLDEESARDGGNGALTDGAISLQKLLASNAISNENGVIYLDTSLAQLLLAHFGMSSEDVDVDVAGDEGDEHGDNFGHVEEVEDDVEESEEGYENGKGVDNENNSKAKHD